MGCEYLIVTLPVDIYKQAETLNQHGMLGWEVIAIDNYTAYLKRPLKPAKGA